MIRAIVTGVTLLGVLGLGACVSNKPSLVGLYKTSLCQSGSGEDTACGEPTAVVDVASNVPAADAATSPASRFAERAEAEYIRAMSDPRMSKDAKALRENLAGALTASTTPLDRRHATRNLTITTSKVGAFNPDDRLQQTEVFITLPSGAGTITSWDNATSIYNTINAGTLQIASTRGGETDLSIGAPSGGPLVASGAQKFTYSNTATQSANGVIQAESLTVAVEDGGQTLHVFRQGGPGVDLTGNVAVKIGFALPGDDKLPLYRLDGLFSGDGKPADPAKVLPIRTEIDVGPQRPLKAIVRMRYVMRHVIGGGGSLAPGTQDVVHHEQTTAPSEVTLVPVEDAYPATFGVFRFAGVLPVAIRMPGLQAESLCFASYDEAQALQRYLALAAFKGKLGDADLGWSAIDGMSGLVPGDLKRLEVRSSCAKPPSAR